MTGPGRLRVTTVAVAVVASVCVPAAVAGAAVAEPPLHDDQPLETAGRAAAAVSFVGVLEVRWSDGKRHHRKSLAVEGGNGSVVVHGGTDVLASPQQRLVEHTGGTWDLLWPVAQSGSGRPAPGRKYQLESLAGAHVVGRTTRLIEVRKAGTLLERLFLDDETGLLLRREQFEAGQGPSRTIEFESIEFHRTPVVPDPPEKVVNLSPKRVSADKVPGGVSAPVALADGYDRLGLYRRPGGIVQVQYSDGLYDLSVFQQQGRLDRHGLPDASRVTVGSASGWHYPWAGGHVLFWEGGGTVYTAVSDAPLAQIVAAAGSIPPARAGASLLSRLRQACRALIQPLGA
jgi:hypothetical protein